MDYTKKLNTVKNDLLAQNPKRLNHILGVAESALLIKEKHFPELEDVRVILAAYMHDFTKEYGEETHREILSLYGIPVDAYENIAPKLLHAKSACAIAKHRYGLDEGICSAVLYHTTGRENMTELEKIIYLADFIEKNRTHISCIDVRDTYFSLIKNNHPNPLDAAILYSLDLTIESLLKKGRVIHINTAQARNFLIKEGVK